jgi:23S rRNA (guanine745-N1)-methyltransferase
VGVGTRGTRCTELGYGRRCSRCRSCGASVVARSPFRCPVCHGRLERGRTALRCRLGHSFDLARAGYVNLLPPRRRRGGDDAPSLRARREFLGRGHYLPLARLLVERLGAARPARVLDAGCGEGSFLRAAAALGPGVERCGIDLSRDAAALAARADPAGEYAVADVHSLPFEDASVDGVLSVFTHRAYDELARVLTPGGLLLVVSPGPDHLLGLRKTFGLGRLRREERPRPARDGPLALRRVERLRYRLSLDPSEVELLLAMTPYGRPARSLASPLETPVDFEVSTLSRRSRACRRARAR